jgi:hypothetical protein
VAEHAGQLVHLLGVLDQAAVDVDEAARDRKRVDFGRIHDVERPRQVGPVRQPRDRITQDVDVAIGLGVVDDRQLLVDLCDVLLPDLDFLLLLDAAGGLNDGQGDHEHFCSHWRALVLKR